MPISYLGQYDDNQRILNQLTEIKSNILVVGGSVTGLGSGGNLATASQVNAIASQLPSLAKGNDVAQLISGTRQDVANVGGKVDAIAQQIPNLAKGNDVAQLIGGVATQGNNIYGDTQALRNTEIPKLATGNQANALSTAITAVGSSVNAGRAESNGISRNNYNAQLNAIQNTGNNANAGVQTVRSEQSGRFNSVDSSLSGISTQIASLTGSNGAASSVVSLNASALIAPYVANNPERDLAYLLGAISTGYSDIGGVAIGVTANSVESGNPASILSKVYGAGWYSTNVSGRFVTLDFGLNKTTRNIVITGLGMQSYDIGAGFLGTLTISGSNNNSSYTTINTWSSIGFIADQQWKYTTFSNNTAYRYLRFAQTGLTSGGSNYFSFRELRLYGTINNP